MTRLARTMARAAGALAITALSAGCDLGPGGRDAVPGFVQGNATLGGVVLEVSWSAVTGFEGRGSTQVYSAPIAGSSERYRVVLISPTPGELPFEIEVGSRFTSAPVVTVVEAVGADNLPVPTGGLRVVLGR